MYPDNLERLCVHMPTTTARKRRDGGQRWVQSRQWLRPPKPKPIVKLGTLLQMSMFAEQSGLRATQLEHFQAEIGHSSVLRHHDFYQLDCCAVCVRVHACAHVCVLANVRVVAFSPCCIAEDGTQALLFWPELHPIRKPILLSITYSVSKCFH